MSKEWESMSILIMQSLGILLSFACKVLMVTQTNLKTCMGDNFIDHGGIVKIFVDKKQNDLNEHADYKKACPGQLRPDATGKWRK